MKKYLVIGSEGFMGRVFCEEILKEKKSYLIKADIRIADKKTPYGADRKADILDVKSIIAVCNDENPDIIINLAGDFTSKIERLFAVNCFSSAELAHKIRDRKCKLVLIGSAAEYGSVEIGTFASEEHILMPVSDYGLSKAYQSYIAMAQAKHSSEPKVIIFRPFNLTGSGVSEYLFVGAFAKQIALIEKRKQEPQIMVGNLESIRDMLPVRTAVKAMLKVIQGCDDMGVFNVCSKIPRKIKDVLNEMLALSKADIAVRIDSTRLKNNDVEWAVGDNKKISKYYDMNITQEEWMSSLKESIEYYRKMV